jgi:hypothetical protein
LRSGAERKNFGSGENEDKTIQREPDRDEDRGASSRGHRENLIGTRTAERLLEATLRRELAA